MNYEKIYNNLIHKSKSINPAGYTERHHIIPRCLGGSDDALNIVNLTPEEHYLAHQLLVKIYPDNISLTYAAKMMTVSSPLADRSKNKLFGWLRRKNAKAQQNKVFSDATRKRMSESAKSKPKIKCPHCDKIGAEGNMRRWHFDNCLKGPTPYRPKVTDEYRENMSKSLKQLKRTTIKCNFCNKTGFTHVIKSHEPYCHNNINRIAKIHPKIKCPHCDIEGLHSNMKRWHFDNCKLKPH